MRFHGFSTQNFRNFSKLIRCVLVNFPENRNQIVLTVKKLLLYPDFRTIPDLNVAFSYLMLLPLTLRVSKLTGSLFLIVIFTDFKCVFIATSTPVIVPWTCVPFFSSSVTVSCDNFIKNLKVEMNN